MTTIDPTSQSTFEAFVEGRLAKGEWTHEAHLVTCWVALADRTPAETLGFLRDAIRSHNCGIGIENTDRSGYHETLTEYYVGAVHQADVQDIDDLFSDERCSRSAPKRHWSADLLFSVEARLGWVDPDLEPLPWGRIQP